MDHMRPLSQTWNRTVLIVWASIWALAGSFAAPLPAAATEVKIFRGATAADFLDGELDGVSVDQLGRLHLAERIDRLTALEEPFLLSAVRLGKGWVVGTGNDGRVLHVAADGKVETLFEAPESEVFALWADPDGTVFAATSPNGKVYRLQGGSSDVFFDPGAVYIWALARSSDGRLLVATGTEGKLFAVDEKGQGTVLLDTDDTHVRSIQPLPGGDVLVGTAGEGLVLRVSAEGKVRTLFDAAQPEIVALTAGGDGSYYAAAVASEASQVDLSKKPESKPASAAGDEEGEDGATVVVEEGASSAVGSRPSGFGGGRSEILSISSDGVVESLWSFEEETVYSLLWHEGKLWLGTGQEGKLYSWRGSDQRMVLEKDAEDSQIVALMTGDRGPSFATTNAAAIYRSAGGSERQGTFTAKAQDAKQLSRFGSFHWWGEEPAGGVVKISVRSGLSAEPDATWSEWSKAVSGHEVPLGDVPRGRYVQWRAELSAGEKTSPRIDAVELSYRQQNLRPRVTDFKALDPGKVLLPANFNPGQQVYEPAHPRRDGIFTTLDTSGPRQDQRVKPLWKLGYRAFAWKAEDPNGDALTYRLDFRPAGGAAEEGEWLPVAEDLDTPYYNFDATVLPDGLYRFRLTASDADANPEDEALSTEALSEPVIIDHGAPAVREIRRRGRVLEVRVEDAWDPLREAVASTDAGEWRAVEAADGLVDGRAETLVVPIPDGARLLLLRLTDAAHNAITVNLSEHIP